MYIYIYIYKENSQCKHVINFNLYFSKFRDVYIGRIIWISSHPSALGISRIIWKLSHSHGLDTNRIVWRFFRFHGVDICKITRT